MFFKPTEDELRQLEELTKEYDTRIEQAADEEEKKALSDECSEKLTDLLLEIDQRHFEKIATSPDAILEDAKLQIETAILHAYEGLVKYGKDREKYMSFATGEARLFSQAAAECAKIELVLHFDALKDNPEYLQRLLDLITEIVKTSEYTDNQAIILAYEPQEELAQNLYTATPNSPIMFFMAKVSSNVRKTKDGRLRVAKSPNNRHENFSMQVEKKKDKSGKETEVLVIEMTNKQSGITARLECREFRKLFGKRNKSFFRLFVYCLQRMNAQSFRPKIIIRLQDMVDLGMYSTAGNALAGINSFYDQQKNMEISGTFKKRKEIIKAGRGQLFFNIEYDKNGCVTLSANDSLNTQFFATFFTILPDFAYNLKKSNAFLLTWYIFYIARQRTKEIKNNGSFIIRLDTIRDMLGLPRIDEVQNRKYKHCIIDPITDAISEIMEGWESAEKGEGDDFKIILQNQDTRNINEWLQGNIEVQLSGTLSDKFISISEKAEEKRKKLEAAKLEAIARQSAKDKKQ